MPDLAVWRDIDVTFAVNPITGDVATVTDMTSIIQHIRLLLSSEAFDVPFHPEVECPLPFFEFELFSDQVRIAATTVVENMLQAYDNRFQLQTLVVTIDSDNNKFTVTGTVQAVASGQTAPFNVVLQRYR